jgi:hypothetical protein
LDSILTANRELGKQAPPEDRTTSGLLLCNGKLVVPEKCLDGQTHLRTELIRLVHNSITSAHPGKNKTKQILRAQYYWKGLGIDVERYIANCRICRWNDPSHDKTPGLLQPLAPPPGATWRDISVDGFSMPKDQCGFDYAWMFTCRLSRRGISLPGYKTDAAQQVAKLYYQYIWRIYGHPESVVSDRGPQFAGAFADELRKILGLQLRIATTGHAQSDGASEIMIQIVKNRLKKFCNHFQDDWSHLLPAMDFAQATLPHDSTGMSPYFVEFGVRPRQIYDWEGRSHDFKSPADQDVRQRAQAFVQRIKEAHDFARTNIRRSHTRWVEQANKYRREPDFGVGDSVYLSNHGLLSDRPDPKLSEVASGPFKILRMVGNSYHLDLPESMSRLHPVFHADRLRKSPENPLPGQREPPPESIVLKDQEEHEVAHVKSARIHYQRLQYKVQWVGWDTDDQWYDAGNLKHAASLVQDFHNRYPHQPGPPKRLQTWLEAEEKGIALDDRPEDNLPASSGRGSFRSRRRARK